MKDQTIHHRVTWDIQEQFKQRSAINHDVTIFTKARMKKEILGLIEESRKGGDFDRLRSLFDQIEQVFTNEGITRLEVLQDSNLWTNRFYPDLVAFWAKCRIEQIKLQKVMNTEEGI